MQTQEFKNDQISVTVTKEPGCRVTMEIVASPSFAKEAEKEAIKAVRKEISMPRFRKGKVPEEIVVKNFSKQIEREFRETFLNESARLAIQLTKLYPWSRDGRVKADVDEASTEKGGKFKVSFESFPEVPLVEPEKITVTEPKKREITDSAIDGHINSLRHQHATWNPVEGRAVESGDFIEATVDILGEDGTPVVPSRRTHIHVHPDHLESWMCDLLIGKEKGFKGSVTPPDEKEQDSLNPSLKTKPRPVQVTIESISTPELTEVDDAFAEKFGVKTVAELREKVKDYLERQEADRVKKVVERAVQKELLSLYDFDMPESIVAQEVEKQREMVKQELQHEHSKEEISNLSEEIEKVAKERANQMLRTHYLLFKVAGEEKLEATESEILRELLMMSMRPDGSVDNAVMEHPERYKESIRQKILLFKAIESIAKKVSKKS